MNNQQIKVRRRKVKIIVYVIIWFNARFETKHCDISLSMKELKISFRREEDYHLFYKMTVIKFIFNPRSACGKPPKAKPTSTVSPN